ncbi:MAG: radical SAM protein [Methanomassiliicoccus sp.]|nr:radical SAM protein [Methanomassiliicoccus sp.]
MTRVLRALIIDGYVDEPACLGVPPYISPQVRAAVGAARAAGAEAEYVTIDQVRQGVALPHAAVSLVLAGSAVPGKYLRAMPASGREIVTLAERLPGIRALGGPAALDPSYAGKFDHLANRDPAASVHDLLTAGSASERWRSMEEWNSWLLAGADTVLRHPDFPQPMVAEVETYRGCVRYASGGCSFCVEPMKGSPSFRDEEDIIAECRKLRELGVVNFRLGAQTCIVSYKADLSAGDPPRPNPGAVERLFSGLSSLRPDVLHVDNANPAVIASYPEESSAVLRSLVRNCTPGNVLALGLESADPAVRDANNLNANAEQAMEAIRAINRVGGTVGPTGLPHLLPGLNFIIGLEGETKEGLARDRAFLRTVLEEGLLLRRINVRQVIPIRRPFPPTVSHQDFMRFKEFVREEIDRPMLERLVPRGRVLRRVFTELHDGNTTFGRQIGSYPLLVGVPYTLELGRFVDVKVIGWGFRSITAIEHPLRINSCSLKALEALPGVGRKRAIRLFRHRPMRGPEDLARALDDPRVTDELLELVAFH